MIVGAVWYRTNCETSEIFGNRAVANRTYIVNPIFCQPPNHPKDVSMNDERIDPPITDLTRPPARLTRRSFLTMTAVAGGLLAAGGLVQAGRRGEIATVREERLLMGTVIHLAVVAPDVDQGKAAIVKTFSAMERLIELFDYRRPQSALATLNRTGSIANPPAEFHELLTLAQTVSVQSDGAFDITVFPLLDGYGRGETDLAPYSHLVDYRRLHVETDRVHLDRPGMAVTLDGLAKGRVIDEGVAALRGLGFDQVLVESGGDLAVLGRRGDGAPWRVGVAHPRDQSAGKLLASLDLAGGALATSGDYMNYFTQDFSAHHIVDPRTGRSPAELAGVTVMAPTAAQADALSTALMVLGPVQGQALAAQWPDVEALFVTKTMEQIHTPGFPTMTGV